MTVDWKPFETAPKDRKILVGWSSGAWNVGRWDAGYKTWVDLRGCPFRPQLPTHWAEGPDFPSRHTDAEYIAFDPFQDADRDVQIRYRKVKIVTTRSEHWCTGGYDWHRIPAGTRSRRETAFVDGVPGSYHCCLDCLDKVMELPFRVEAER